LQFLIACALIAVMSETTMAQQMMSAEKCQKLHLTDFTFERDQSGNQLLYALISNDTPYDLVSATFNFDLLVGQDLKVGEGTVYIGRLMHGNKERVRINYRTNEDIKGYISAGAIAIQQLAPEALSTLGERQSAQVGPFCDARGPPSRRAANHRAAHPWLKTELGEER
jgi:hypothetical protein